MIYNTITERYAGLREGWGRLTAALQTLHSAIPADNAEIRNVLLSQIQASQPVTDAMRDNPTDLAGRFADTAALLNNAQQVFNSSHAQAGTTAAAVQLLLPVLRSSDSPQVREAAFEVERQLDALRQGVDHSLREMEEMTTEFGMRASIGGISRSVEALGAYPIQFHDSGFGGGSSGVGGAGGGRPLGAVVENAVRDVLGWRPKTSDHKGFLAALTQSFEGREIEGRTEYRYTPRTYAVQVQADMGAITGAQASIYARAKAALDQSLAILDRLYPLAPEADKQEVEASRAIVRSELTELVNELGVEGGPRVHRVNALFRQLRGTNNTDFDPERVGGQLQRMRENLGLTRDNVNTIEEEQDLTDFITLVDYIGSLQQSWDNQRRFFDRRNTAEPYLGTHLVLLSRALAVVAESVREVYNAMDSVFLRAAERQTIELRFTSEAPIFVSELLAWVDRFASEEAPLLIQDAGKAGVQAFSPTVEQLTGLVRGSLIPPQDGYRLPAAYRTGRVQRALQELATHLQRTADLARDLQPRL